MRNRGNNKIEDRSRDRKEDEIDKNRKYDKNKNKLQID